MRLIKSLVFFILISSTCLTLSTSCTFDNEEELLEDFVCDTTDLIYSDLTFIFTDVCAQCHSEESTPRIGIMMDSYENVKASVNTGKVLPAINHTGNYAMPYEQPKLSDCNIEKIEAWIHAGMPEN